MPIRIAKSVNSICTGLSVMPVARSRRLMTPSLRMISSMAKVRIRRLVQNGIVIRNSQTSRERSARVEMK